MTKSNKPGDYARCENCGRMTHRDHLKAGPNGLRLGPECYRRIVAQSG